MTADHIRDTRPGARTDAAMLTLTMVTVLAGNTVATPLLPAYRARWHLSVSLTAWVFAVYVIGVVVALIVFGRLADAIGDRVVVLVAVAVCVAATVLALLSRTVGWLVVARVVQGLAAGLIPGATTAALATAVPGPTAARLASLATTSGIAGGLLLAGALADLGAAAVWLAQLALLVPVTLWAFAVVFRSGRSDRPGHWAVARPVVPREGRGEFLLALVGAAVAFAGMGLFAGLGPLLLGPHRSDHAIVGAAVAAAAYLVSGAVQLAGARWGPAAGLGGPVLAAGVAALATAVALGNLPLLVVAAVLVGAGNGSLFPRTLATATRLAPPGRRAGATSTFYLALDAGIAGPLIGLGLLADATSLAVAVLVFALVTGSAAIALTLLGRRERHPVT